MQSQSFANPAGWIIVLIGFGLAALAGLTPHFATGYYLHIGIIAANVAPYLVYMVAVPLIPGAVTTSAGLLLLAAHGAVVLSERFIDGADYSDGMIYSAPLVLAVLMLPLAVFAMVKTATPPQAKHGHDEDEQDSPQGETG